MILIRRLLIGLADEFKKEEGIDLEKIQWLCKDLKKLLKKQRLNFHLSSATEINLPFITADARWTKTFEY